jgi:hypothetical protein
MRKVRTCVHVNPSIKEGERISGRGGEGEGERRKKGREGEGNRRGEKIE